MSFPRRVRPAFAVLIAAFVFSSSATRAALPDYKLGEVAAGDVIAPVAFTVPNPEATEALRQKVSQQVPFIVRQTTPSADAAEAELRASIAAARKDFLATFQRALDGRPPVAADLESPAFAVAIREFVRQASKDLPLGALATLWVKGQSDEGFVATLLEPLRAAMVQPILASKDPALPTNQLVRIIPVKTAAEVPSVQDLENSKFTFPAGKMLTLWRARRLVETHFPAGQEELGRFAAAFVRANAYPDAALTEILRAKQLEGVTVNDTYEAAQVVVRKGQIVDRRALGALASLREKSLIGTLQTKLDQEQSVAGQITQQTRWLIAGLGGIGLVLGFVAWRLRSRPGSLVPAMPQLAEGTAWQALPGGDEPETWRHRAVLAEGKAERAHAAIRSGVLGWMREKIFHSLFRQRAELLSVQQKAQAEMGELEQRMEQLHTPLQERISAYEQRIEELESELAAKGEENRELLGARISVAKQRLTLERERGRFGSN